MNARFNGSVILIGLQRAWLLDLIVIEMGLMATQQLWLYWAAPERELGKGYIENPC